jgi:hypothetical protein
MASHLVGKTVDENRAASEKRLSGIDFGGFLGLIPKA